jgi:hypothetical protein
LSPSLTVAVLSRSSALSVILTLYTLDLMLKVDWGFRGSRERRDGRTGASKDVGHGGDLGLFNFSQ